jgi:2-polyprenyl-3-methyl-5-hydroxy-6-metoxy-1,4-benzoquinol methylase
MRFAFGKNWRSFLSVLNETRISEAQRAIGQSLGQSDMRGQRVLDIGSGSGLSSLAMYRMGAEVTSFDYDRDSVACTEQLRELHAANNSLWRVSQGSVLDSQFMHDLGHFDLVYAWGVLHHTGAMWDALDLAQQRVAPGGQLLIALYNDQGWKSRFWRQVKQIYCSNRVGRWLVTTVFYPLFALYTMMLDARNLDSPGTYMRKYNSHRGMSILHDWRDWLGGFPFETATPEKVLEVLSRAGFDLKSKTLTKGWGCNEFVLTRRRVSHGI